MTQLRPAVPQTGVILIPPKQEQLQLSKLMVVQGSAALRSLGLYAPSRKRVRIPPRNRPNIERFVFF